ncbi:MAG: hypothetical protein K2X46_10035, partial [Roseomonas sp.]|nr:hypothetical protein [Roseomonas sp.]
MRNLVGRTTPAGCGIRFGGDGVHGFLDTSSMLFSAAVGSLVGSLLLLRGRAHAFRGCATAVPAAWLAAAFLQALATFGHSMRGALSPSVVYGLVNTVQILAVSLIWLGAGRLKGVARPGWMALVAPGIWLLAFMVPGVMASQSLRLAVYAPLTFGPLLWAVTDLFGVWRRHRVRAALDMAVVLGFVALFLGALVVQTIFVPRTPDDVRAMFLGVPGLITALFATMLPFLMLAVMREWDSIEERRRRGAALQAGRREVERLHAGLPAIVFLSRVTMDDNGLHIVRVYRGGDTLAVLGWPEGDLAGMHDLQSISDYGGATLADHYRQTVARGEHGWEF